MHFRILVYQYLQISHCKHLFLHDTPRVRLTARNLCSRIRWIGEPTAWILKFLTLSLVHVRIGVTCKSFPCHLHGDLRNWSDPSHETFITPTLELPRFLGNTYPFRYTGLLGELTIVAEFFLRISALAERATDLRNHLQASWLTLRNSRTGFASTTAATRDAVIIVPVTEFASPRNTGLLWARDALTHLSEPKKSFQTPLDPDLLRRLINHHSGYINRTRRPRVAHRTIVWVLVDGASMPGRTVRERRAPVLITCVDSDKKKSESLMGGRSCQLAQMRISHFLFSRDRQVTLCRQSISRLY